MRKQIVKRLAIALLAVIFIAALLFVIQLWEDRHGNIDTPALARQTIEYKGRSYVLNDQIQTMLVIGLDKYMDAADSDSHQSGSTQADFLMLFVIDNSAKKITAVQISRDTIANVNRLDIVGNKIGTERKQIALAYEFAYDDRGSINCRNTADSVSDLLLNIKVNHYFSLTMDSVAELNDLVGGVTVTVLDDFTGIDDTLRRDETVTLHGEQALRYVRARHGMEDSSNAARMKRQQQYIKALLDALNDCKTADDEFALKAFNQMKPFIQYDSTEYRLKEFAEKCETYEFAGIKEIEGTLKQGEEFMEFYPDQDSLLRLVLNLFYTPDMNGNK